MHQENNVSFNLCFFEMNVTCDFYDGKGCVSSAMTNITMHFVCPNNCVLLFNRNASDVNLTVKLVDSS